MRHILMAALMLAGALVTISVTASVLQARTTPAPASQSFTYR